MKDTWLYVAEKLEIVIQIYYNGVTGKKIAKMKGLYDGKQSANR